MVEFVELAILALEERWARREFRGMKMQEAAANISNYVSDGKTSLLGQEQTQCTTSHEAVDRADSPALSVTSRVPAMLSRAGTSDTHTFNDLLPPRVCFAWCEALMPLTYRHIPDAGLVLVLLLWIC